jgi:hypothetical protein
MPSDGHRESQPAGRMGRAIGAQRTFRQAMLVRGKRALLVGVRLNAWPAAVHRGEGQLDLRRQNATVRAGCHAGTPRHPGRLRRSWGGRSWS